MRLRDLSHSRLYKSNEIGLFAKAVEGQIGIDTICYLSPISKLGKATSQGFLLLGTSHQIESFIETFGERNRAEAVKEFIFFGLPIASKARDPQVA